MTGIVPTIGRVVWYRLNDWDVREIFKRRGAAFGLDYVGNEPEAGAIYPAIVVRVWGESSESAVNLKVLLDGFDDYWASSRVVGTAPGSYQWMPYQIGQAKKHEASANANVPQHQPGSSIVATSSGDHV